MSVDMQFMQDLRDGKHLEGLSPDAKRKADEITERFPIIPKHTNGCYIHCCLDVNIADYSFKKFDHHPSQADVNDFLLSVGIKLTEKEYIKVMQFKGVYVKHPSVKSKEANVWLTSD